MAAGWRPPLGSRQGAVLAIRWKVKLGLSTPLHPTPGSIFHVWGAGLYGSRAQAT